jgi:MFS family permease
MATGIALIAIAMVSIGLGSSIAFMYIGTTIAGIGLSFVMPSMFMYLGTVVHPSQMPTTSGIIMASMNVGGFCSAYFFAIVSGIMGVNMTVNIKFPFYVSMIAFAAIAVALLFVKPKQQAAPQPE